MSGDETPPGRSPLAERLDQRTRDAFRSGDRRILAQRIARGTGKRDGDNPAREYTPVLQLVRTPHTAASGTTEDSGVCHGNQ